MSLGLNVLLLNSALTRDHGHLACAIGAAADRTRRGRAGVSSEGHVLIAGIASLAMLFPGAALAQTDIGCTAANALFGAILGGGRQVVPCKDGSAPAQTTAPTQPRAPADRLMPDQRAALGRVVPKVQRHYQSLDPETGARSGDHPCVAFLREEWQSGRMQSLLHVTDECVEQTNGAQSEYRQRRAAAAQRRQTAAEEHKAAEDAREEAERSRRAHERFNAYAAQVAAQEERENADARQLVQDLRSGKKSPAGCVEWLIAQGQNPAEMKAPVTTVAIEPPRGLGTFWGEVLQLGAAKALLFDGDTITRNILGDSGSKHLVVSIDSNTKIFRGAGIQQRSAARGFGTQTGVQDVRMTDGSVQRSPAIAATCLEPGGSYK